MLLYIADVANRTVEIINWPEINAKIPALPDFPWRPQHIVCQRTEIGV